jgi:hypothetical protein
MFANWADGEIHTAGFDVRDVGRIDTHPPGQLRLRQAQFATRGADLAADDL